MEKEVPEKNNNLVNLVGGIAISVITLLPVSGCVESYNGYGGYEAYHPRVYGPVIINPPIYRRQIPHYAPPIHRNFRPQISPPHRQFNPPQSFRPHQQFNNGPYRNYPHNQRQHRR